MKNLPAGAPRLRYLLFLPLALLFVCRTPSANAQQPTLANIPFLSPPFPRLTGHTRITLRRGAGYFGGSSYTVSIDQNGRIDYVGFSGVVVFGKHIAQTSPDAFQELLKSFREKNFFAFDDVYRADITDLPTFALKLDSGSIHKQVIDYGGQRAFMPADVTFLEHKVDAVTGSSRWTEGSEGIVPLLVAEHFNFRSKDALPLLAASASRNDAVTFDLLLAHGVSLRDNGETNLVYAAALGGNPHILTVVLDGCRCIPATELTEALSWSAGTGDTTAMHILLAHGADPNLATSGDLPLVAAAKACQSSATQLLLERHPNLNERSEGYPLNMLPSGYFGGSNPAACIDTLELLKAAGVDPKAPDEHGNTALHVTTEPLIAEWFLNEGLDSNARNDLGKTPLFTNPRDSVIELLLRQGADPRLKDQEGRNPEDSNEYDSTERRTLLRRYRDQKK